MAREGSSDSSDPARYWSPSKIETWMKCKRMFYWRYVMGLKKPPGGAALRGITVHAAAEHNYRQKIETHKDLPLEEVQQAASDAWAAKLPEIEMMEDDDPKQLRSQVDAAVPAYHAKVAPKVQPVEVEAKFLATMGGHEIQGYPDVVTADLIRDTKTSTKTKNPAELGWVQPTIYEHVKGKPFLFDQIVCLSKEVRHVETKPEPPGDKETTIRVLTDEIGIAKHMIRQGLFPHATPGSWFCSKKWCGYYQFCFGSRRDA